jgi:F0F1-type ATP synthase assembly protein I
MPEGREDQGAGRTPASQAGEVLGVGLQFAASIVLFLFVGRWLDEKLGTEPWLLLAGVLIGACAGFYSLYRQLVISPRERAEKERAAREKNEKPG